jgi:hypothetical protein
MKPLLILIILFFAGSHLFAQKKKSQGLNVKGIPENNVREWIEDDSVYTVNKMKLHQKMNISQRHIHASMEFDTVDFQKGLEFKQDSIFTLEFWNCNVNMFAILNMSSDNDLLFSDCRSIHADTNALKKNIRKEIS